MAVLFVWGGLMFGGKNVEPTDDTVLKYLRGTHVTPVWFSSLNANEVLRLHINKKG